METTQSERIKIGAFMLFCGVLILVFLGYVLSRYLTREYDHYYTVFNESVIGLYNEAQVKLNGIDVGNVTGIQIDSSNLNQVIVSFRVEKGTPVKLGTRAGMTHGISLTGEKQIVLSGGRFDEPNVQEGGFVPAEATAFDQIASKASDIIGHVDTLMINLSKLFSEDNANNISLALNHFEGATKNLQQITQSLNKPLDNISGAAASMQKAAESMQHVMAEIEDAKIASKASENLDVLKTKLDAIDTKNINDNLMQAIEAMSELSKRLDQTVYKNQDQIDDAITELNSVLGNLVDFTQKIKNNPSLLIRSETKTRRK